MTRFLALGDSYTIGEGVSDEERWPAQLVATLGERGVTITDLQVFARTAWTSDELLDAIDEAKPAGPYDLVTLLVGVNDQYRSRPVDGFGEEFRKLLRRSKRLAGGRARRTIALSIPDWGATPYADGRDRALIRSQIESYNECARELAAGASAHWVDVTEASRAMQHDRSLVAIDGLHPTGAMYRRWAELIAPIAAKALAR